ncbi:hypothetical protein AAVH_41179 [Aphelenchoides avenae]|nr:hypothetical protein AAVH_41179 [Aphelenchus avenae]
MGNCETTSRGEGGAALVRSAAGKDLSPAAFTARTSVSSSSPAPNQIQPISPSIGPNSMATTPTSPGGHYMTEPPSPLPYSSAPATAQTPQKAAEISRRIDDQLIKEHHAMERIVKLLLLGTSFFAQ